jgi:hypothetical protein
MRVEQLLGNYTRLSGRQQGKKGQKGFYPARGLARGAVMDMVCISDDEIEQDFGWFAEYVRQIPDDAVREKIRQIYYRQPYSDEFLVEKLMFEVF